MLVIGLTGGIACGKTTAAAALRALGAPIFDADAVSRALTNEGGAAADDVRARFGTLDRKKIAAVVFHDPAALADLNAIIHPRVNAALDEFLCKSRASGAPVCVLDVPLLFECGMDALCGETWVVSVPQEEQISRVIARDRATREQALARIAAQMPMDEKRRRADAVIDTSGPVEETQKRVAALYAQARERADR